MDILYDRIGGAYAETRRPDPRISRVIRAALGDAASVVAIGGDRHRLDRHHLGLAKENGATENELIEAITHLAI